MAYVIGWSLLGVLGFSIFFGGVMTLQKYLRNRDRRKS